MANGNKNMRSRVSGKVRSERVKVQVVFFCKALKAERQRRTSCGEREREEREERTRVVDVSLSLCGVDEKAAGMEVMVKGEKAAVWWDARQCDLAVCDHIMGRCRALTVDVHAGYAAESRKRSRRRASNMNTDEEKTLERGRD